MPEESNNKVQEKAKQVTAMFSQVYAELVNSQIGSNIMDESELYKLASELAIPTESYA